MKKKVKIENPRNCSGGKTRIHMEMLRKDLVSELYDRFIPGVTTKLKVNMMMLTSALDKDGLQAEFASPEVTMCDLPPEAVNKVLDEFRAEGWGATIYPEDSLYVDSIVFYPDKAKKPVKKATRSTKK